MSNYFLAGVLVGLLMGGVLGSLAMCLVVVGSKGRSYSAQEATPPKTGRTELGRPEATPHR